MLFRSMVVIVLIAFVNLLFIDCTGKKTIKKTPREVAAVEKITAAVLHSGDVVSFDRAGAVFKTHDSERIVGKTPGMQIVSLPLENIIEVRKSSQKLFKKIGAFEGKRIAELLDIRGLVVRFDSKGAYYDYTNGLVKGTTIEGEQFSEKLESIVGVRNAAEVISKDELSSESQQFIAEVVTDRNQLISFDRNGGKYFEAHSAVSGFTRKGEYVELEPLDILYVRVEKFDAATAIFGSLGVLLLLAGSLLVIIAATKESCPFVYSYNGDQYVFDAEPLGGAVCPGLAKTDFSRLENLKPVNGEYQLMFRNEVEEIQYLDRVRLVYMDHSPRVEIVPDLQGHFYSITKPQPPTSSINEDGLDLTNFIKQSDGIFWQTKLPMDDSYKTQPLRHQLRFTFPKPAQAKQAHLVVNAGTALWGSNMIREMLQLRGSKVDEWYAKINNHGPELFELYHFMEREELYSLKILAKKGDEWIQKGIIPGGGPLITEDHIIPLDLSDISGDELELQLSPPKGFWTLDYIAMSYETTSPLITNEIALNRVTDHKGTDVTTALLNEDNTYYEMPEVGDWAKFYFTAPPLSDGLDRTVFLETTGYYEIQIDKTQPEQTQLIRELTETPGLIVDYSLNEFLKWHSQMAAVGNK